MYVEHVKFYLVETLRLAWFLIGMDTIVHIAAKMGGGGEVQAEHELLFLLVYLLLAQERIDSRCFNYW